MTETKREIARWNPSAELEAFSALRDFPRFGRLMEEMLGTHGAAAGGMALDVTESDDRYAISAELPGVKREDLTVECAGGVLSIRAEKKSEREEKKERGRLLERSYGAFSRSLRLPADANADDVKASFSDGVLSLEIPKRGEAKAKTIAVKG